MGKTLRNIYTCAAIGLAVPAVSAALVSADAAMGHKYSGMFNKKWDEYFHPSARDAILQGMERARNAPRPASPRKLANPFFSIG